MSDYGANPFVDPEPWYTVKLGGLVVAGRSRNLPVLVKVDGVKVEDEWAEDKGTGKSGASSKFKGTKPPGSALELELKAHNRQSFALLRNVWDMLEPVPSPGFGLAAAPTAAAAPAAAPASGFPVDDTKKADKGAANPGPKPPTVSIENAWVQYIGVTSVARRSWELTYNEGERSWTVKVGFVSIKETTTAGAGAASPAKPDVAVAGASPKFGSANGGDASAAAADANTKIGQAAAA